MGQPGAETGPAQDSATLPARVLPRTGPDRTCSALFIAPGRVPLRTPPRPCAPKRVPRSHRPFVELVSFIYYNTESYIKFSIKPESFLP